MHFAPWNIDRGKILTRREMALVLAELKARPSDRPMPGSTWSCSVSPPVAVCESRKLPNLTSATLTLASAVPICALAQGGQGWSPAARSAPVGRRHTGRPRGVEGRPVGPGR